MCKVDLDLSMRTDYSDGLTKVSDEEKVVIRVLRRYGASEELFPVDDARTLRQAIDIRAEFVRIVPPLSGKSNTEGFTMDIDGEACHALIGNKNKLAIYPDGFPTVVYNVGT